MFLVYCFITVMMWLIKAGVFLINIIFSPVACIFWAAICFAIAISAIIYMVRQKREFGLIIPAIASPILGVMMIQLAMV